MNWISPFIKDYHTWLMENTLVRQNSNSDWVTIQTPMLDIFNDNIEIFARKDGDRIILSDDGATLNNLSYFGVRLNKGERKSIADKILFTLGIDLKNDELTTVCRETDFPQKKHNMLSAMLEISQLSVLSEKSVVSLFKEDVRDYLMENKIVFTPEFISQGVTGMEFTFDFQVAGFTKEKVLKTFNTINKQSLSSFLFAWDDIKPVREKLTKKDVHAVAIINDQKKPVAPEFIEALKIKQADYVLWSERTEPDWLDKIRA